MAVDAGRSRAALFGDLGWRRPNPAAIGSVLALAALLPVLWQNDYVIDVALTALIWMILNQSWNLQLGFGGIWNFGQLAIFAVGAYASALVALHWGVPAWMAMIMGGLGASLASLVIAIPALRLRGIYASLLTFSFGEVVRLLVISDESGVTGGTFGLAGVPDLAFGGLSPDARQRAYYWLALAIVTLVAVFIYVFVHSPLGTALRALRDSPGYAASRGISPLRMQVITFCASAFIAGIAGAFYAHYFGVISPSVMGLGPMALFVAMLVVGGLGTLSGPLLGTALVMLVSEYLRDYQESRLIIVGVILLVTMVVAPRGLVPALGGGWARIQRWMAEDEGTDADHPHRSSAQTASESSPAPAGTEREDP